MNVGLEELGNPDLIAPKGKSVTDDLFHVDSEPQTFQLHR